MIGKAVCSIPVGHVNYDEKHSFVQLIWFEHTQNLRNLNATKKNKPFYEETTLKWPSVGHDIHDKKYPLLQHF